MHIEETKEQKAVRLLGLIVAEWRSDPTSVACFDLRIVKEATELVEAHQDAAYDPNDATDLKKRAIFEATLSQWGYHRAFHILYGGNCAGVPSAEFIAEQILDGLDGDPLILTNAAGDTLEVGGDMGEELDTEEVEAMIVGIKFVRFECVQKS